MTHHAAVQAVIDRWFAQWIGDDAQPLTLTVFENEAGVEPSIPDDHPPSVADLIAASWVRLTFRTLPARGQYTLGAAPDRRHERRFNAIFQLFTPTDCGADVSRDLAERVRTIFESTEFGNVVIDEVAARELGTDQRWFQTNVEAVCRFDEMK